MNDDDYIDATKNKKTNREYILSILALKYEHSPSTFIGTISGPVEERKTLDRE